MDKSAALFRASNIVTLDYPLDAALISALAICDEAVVVVDVNSRDDTRDVVYELWKRLGRIKIVEREWKFDRMWQEKVWNWGSEATDAEWLMFHDADEAIHEDHVPEIKGAMDNPDVKLIRFPFIHLYATSAYKIKFQLTHNTRLGRRSVSYRMRNWCRDDHPKRAVCQMVYGQEEYNAHLSDSPILVTLENVPVMHYGWCRSALALAISQRKHLAWYADGGGLGDGRIPDIAPWGYELAEKIEGGSVTPYDGPHPAGMQAWFEKHVDEWEALERE